MHKSIDSPFVQLPEVERKVSEELSEGRYEAAASLISTWAQIIALNQNFVGKYIYLPTMDNLVKCMSEMILSGRRARSRKSGKVPVIVATAIYPDGGHTRIIEDFVRINPDSLLILTNYSGPLGEGEFSFSPKAIGVLPILSLPNDSAVNNIIRLNDICSNIASEVYLLNHHHDVVANAALCSNFDAPVFFIHHSDHRVCLGAANDAFVHVDMVPHMFEMCGKFLQGSVEFWPQGVNDLGEKSYQYPLESICTASSGGSVKYSWDGSLSYPLIIRKLLNSGVENHYHIGHLSDDRLHQIRSDLIADSIDLGRFKYIERVDSLWKALLDLPIHFFVGSAPVHGLRTSIEVQGAGVPILPFFQKDADLLCEKELYGDQALFWSIPNDIPEMIWQSVLNHSFISFKTREHYLKNYSMDLMKNRIQESLLLRGVSR